MHKKNSAKILLYMLILIFVISLTFVNGIGQIGLPNGGSAAKTRCSEIPAWKCKNYENCETKTIRKFFGLFRIAQCTEKTASTTISCGDGKINQLNEQCDKDDFGSIGIRCASYSAAFESGNLTCDKNCNVSTQKCIAKEVCGNNVCEENESDNCPICATSNPPCLAPCYMGTCPQDCFECAQDSDCQLGSCPDGTNFKRYTCLNNKCIELATLSGSFADPCLGHYCGDGLCTGNEQINCTKDCFNAQMQVCGNGIAEGNEQCDGSQFKNLNGQCASYSKDFVSGQLKCTSSCKINTTECVLKSMCTDSDNGKNLKSKGTAETNALSSQYATATDYCIDEFTLNEAACNSDATIMYYIYTCEFGCSEGKCKQPVCGDKIIDGNEKCDSTNFGGKSTSCSSFNSAFQSGTLKCGSNCQIDTSGCVTASQPAAVTTPSTQQPTSALGRSLVDMPDETSSNQIHFMYVLPNDGIDQNLDTNGKIVTSVAAFQKWLMQQTNGKKLRIDTYQGILDITFFRLSRSDASIKSSGGYVRDQIESELLGAGFNAANKIYAVYYGGSSTYSCGGAFWPPSFQGKVVAMYLLGTPPNAPACYTNNLGSSENIMGYWEFAMLHDIFHTLGIVASCAPHHTLAGHVSDSNNDLMWAGNAPWGIPNIQLDIGHDDYYALTKKSCNEQVDLLDSPFLTS